MRLIKNQRATGSPPSRGPLPTSHPIFPRRGVGSVPAPPASIAKMPPGCAAGAAGRRRCGFWGPSLMRGCRGTRARFGGDGSFSEQHHISDGAGAASPARRAPRLWRKPHLTDSVPMFFLKRREKRGGLLAAGIGALNLEKKRFEATVVLAGRAGLGLAGRCCWHGGCRSSVPAGLARRKAWRP